MIVSSKIVKFSNIDESNLDATRMQSSEAILRRSKAKQELCLLSLGSRIHPGCISADLIPKRADLSLFHLISFNFTGYISSNLTLSCYLLREFNQKLDPDKFVLDFFLHSKTFETKFITIH